MYVHKSAPCQEPYIYIPGLSCGRDCFNWGSECIRMTRGRCCESEGLVARPLPQTTLRSVQTRRYSCAKSLLISHIKKQVTSSAYLSASSEISQDLQLFCVRRASKLHSTSGISPVWFFFGLSFKRHAPLICHLCFTHCCWLLRLWWNAYFCHCLIEFFCFFANQFRSPRTSSSAGRKKKITLYSNFGQTISPHPQAFVIQQSQSNG